jgi:hypothetical protein
MDKLPLAVDKRVRDVGAVRTEHLLDIVIDLNPPLVVGDGPLGRRIVFGAAGGSFAGPRLRGEVLPGGGDWSLFRPDGVMSLDVRLTLRTHDDALLHMTYAGRWVTPSGWKTEGHRIDPASYYFRTAVLFETGAPDYLWLNDIVCVGSGYLVEGGIAYQVSQVA